MVKIEHGLPWRTKKFNPLDVTGDRIRSSGWLDNGPIGMSLMFATEEKGITVERHF